ncbi:hypothetical protein Tco_0631825 [Tanacetum coccineum]
MSASNQQTLTDSGANDRPPMLEKGNYFPWESRFRRFLDNKLDDGEQIWRSIPKGPYVRPMITDQDDTTQQLRDELLLTRGGELEPFCSIRPLTLRFEGLDLL